MTNLSTIDPRGNWVIRLNNNGNSNLVSILLLRGDGEKNTSSFVETGVNFNLGGFKKVDEKEIF